MALVGGKIQIRTIYHLRFVSEYSSLLLDNRKCEKVDNGMCE